MLFVPEINSGGSRNDSVILSRRKRYVAFPDGSTMIVSFLFFLIPYFTFIPVGILHDGANYSAHGDFYRRGQLGSCIRPT